MEYQNTKYNQENENRPIFIAKMKDQNSCIVNRAKKRKRKKEKGPMKVLIKHKVPGKI